MCGITKEERINRKVTIAIIFVERDAIAYGPKVALQVWVMF